MNFIVGLGIKAATKAVSDFFPPAHITETPEEKYRREHPGGIRTDTVVSPDGKTVTTRTVTWDGKSSSSRAPLPPAGSAEAKEKNIVDLNPDIGKSVIEAQARAQDKIDHPKKGQHVDHMAMVKHPGLILKHLWDVTKGTAGYVAWNYNDFYQHFATWKGSYMDLLGDVKFMWRALVTGLLTVVLLEVFPLLESLGRLLWDIFHVIRMAFGLVERATEELFWFLTVIWNDTEEFIRRFL